MCRSAQHHSTPCKNPGIAVICTLTLAVLLAGCDGGLFGTGDGTETPDIEIGSPGDNVEQPGVTTDPDSPIPNVGDPAVSLQFSNTTPSGINQANTPLPALKIINLTDIDLSVSTTANPSNVDAIDAPAGQTSELVSVNTGETTIILNTAIDARLLAEINPLNAVADSLTSLFLGSADKSPENASPDIQMFALGSRGAASVEGMVDVRVITLLNNALSTNANQYTLTSVQGESAGSELTFTQAPDDTRSESYSLANAGNYVLSSSDNAFPPTNVNLPANTVYTLVITGDEQTPVYIEMDSLEAAP